MQARRVHITGTVQGVGFRPFVYRLARQHDLNGWVLNGEDGVRIHVEGVDEAVQGFLSDLGHPPPAASIAELTVEPVPPEHSSHFCIRESERQSTPTVRISPDLNLCDACLAELNDPFDRRYAYPYINCTDCGPRYSIIEGLPYDRPFTTMKAWALCPACDAEYRDPLDRRFHAQPVACPACGPHYYLQQDGERLENNAAIREAARLLAEGHILAVKGLGGYHLACDALNTQSVTSLRERKFRKEKPFALMAKDLATARRTIHLSAAAEAHLTSVARPIVLARGRLELPLVAPDTRDLGVMLPYTPLHHLLFGAGAPHLLVMTSANRSSEPMTYLDNDAHAQLAGIADAFLTGERPIARRVDDSVVKVSAFGPSVLRRARGYAPGAVTQIPTRAPILALGADLKNSVTLVVDGQAFVSQHLGDLDHYPAFEAFQETVTDLTEMYAVDLSECLLAYDAHPAYGSSQYAHELPAKRRVAIQHHRAHVASVLAERRAWETRVLGVAFDGTGYGDDGSIWGGEIFVGRVAGGFERVAHLRPAVLPGGDAAARHPVQAAAGFLCELDAPDLRAPPFHFPRRYTDASSLIQKDIQVFPTTSVGRLFDTAAALLGFTRAVSFEGQAAMGVEHLAHASTERRTYPFPFIHNELDYRPLLEAVVEDRRRGVQKETIARAFHNALADGLFDAVTTLAEAHEVDTVVLSGGVFQNGLLLELLKTRFDGSKLTLWTNQHVPPNDGGISLGQAALAAFDASA